jgi:hypothetical protein
MLALPRQIQDEDWANPAETESAAAATSSAASRLLRYIANLQ